MLSVSSHLQAFTADLRALTPKEMFERYVAPDACMALLTFDPMKLRERIARKFSVDLPSVIIVGSAKLGFTLRPKPEEQRPRFAPFYEGSDVDVAIVSADLYDSIWRRCFDFWCSSGYAFSTTYWPGARDFQHYLFRGWMRPDKLPSEGRNSYKNEWFDFFKRDLARARAAGYHSVTAGVYRDAHFLSSYQQIAIGECKASTP